MYCRCSAVGILFLLGRKWWSEIGILFDIHALGSLGWESDTVMGYVVYVVVFGTGGGRCAGVE